MPKSAIKSAQFMHIRDPIHGSVEISIKEVKLIDDWAFQRLRNIKQLGFSELAFPGATHTRYSHSLGAMHVATRIFDQLFPASDLPDNPRLQFRQAARLAMLFHDLGHAPLSHATEMAMPPVTELNLPVLSADTHAKATHEDYTLKLILDSPLTQKINLHFSDLGLEPKHIAALIDERFDTTYFKYHGLDYSTILRQIVTSECDADRMDHLQRDSVYCGVNYGKFDADWLMHNVSPVEKDGKLYLGIKNRALFSFEDFLLSRYHMFASVYLHHAAVIFEKMLEQYLLECPTEFQLPTDIEQYVQMDDIAMWNILRSSKNEWAKRICQRRPYQLLDERLEHRSHTEIKKIDHEELTQWLISKKVHAIHIMSGKALSKYAPNGPIPLYVINNAGNFAELESYTDLFRRYKNPAKLSRVFVSPEQKPLAQKLLTEFINEH